MTKKEPLLSLKVNSKNSDASTSTICKHVSSPEVKAEATILKELIHIDEQTARGTGFLKWLTHVSQTYSLLVVLGMVFATSLGSVITFFLWLTSSLKQPASWSVLPFLGVAFALPICIMVAAITLYSIVKLVRGQFFNVGFARARAIMLIATVEAEEKPIILEQEQPNQKRMFDNRALDFSHFKDMFGSVSPAKEGLFQIWHKLPPAEEVGVAQEQEERLVMRIHPGTAQSIDLLFSHKAFWICCLLGGVLLPLRFWLKFRNLHVFDVVSCIYGGLILGGSLWASFTIGWHIYADLRIACRKSNGTIAYTKKYHPVDVLQARILKHNIKPWSRKLSQGEIQTGLNTCLEELITKSSEYQTSRVAAQPPTTWRTLLLRFRPILGFLVAFLMTIGLLYYLGRSIEEVWLLFPLMVSALVVIGLICGFHDHFYHTFKAPGFLLFLFGLFIVLIIFLSAGFHTTEPLPTFSTEPRTLPPSVNGKWTRSNNYSQAPYPVCLMSWGAHSELNVIDLAILSSYAYIENTSSYESGGAVYNSTSQAFEDSYSQTIATIIAFHNYSEVGRVIATRFFNPHDSSTPATTVLAVKGSSEAFDFYEDMNLWAMVFAFQVLVPFFNLLDLMPNWFFAYFFDWFPHTNDQAFQKVKDVYSQLHFKYPKDSFIVTGHSLGGGIAAVAGGNLSIPAVSFSGPGSHFSRYRFGTTMERTFRSVVDIKPQSDLIHKFDRHDDVGQRIACQKSSMISCHSIYSTICELWRVCGHRRPRDFSSMCKDVFRNDEPPKSEYLSEGQFGE